MEKKLVDQDINVVDQSSMYPMFTDEFTDNININNREARRKAKTQLNKKYGKISTKK